MKSCQKGITTRRREQISGNIVARQLSGAENGHLDQPAASAGSAAVRALDWRFLLPSPQLGKVVCLGPVASEIMETLPLFCESVVIIETPNRDKGQGQYDLAFVTDCSANALHHACRLLRAGGFIYWAIDRRCAWRQSAFFSLLRPVQALAGRLQQAGFTDVAGYWHRPDFDHCLDIIPFDDGVSLSVAFSHRPGTVRKWLKFAVGKILWRTGLLARLAPCVSFVARKETL